MPNDRLHQLEQRVADLEKEVRRIRGSLNESQEPWWQRTAGMFKGDKVFSEIVRLGRDIRRGKLMVRIAKPRKRSLAGRNKKNSPTE